MVGTLRFCPPYDSDSIFKQQKARLRIPAARCARVMHHLVALENERAQGTPDAGRTREPCVQRKVHFAHASNDRAAGTAGIPCANGLRLIRDLPGVPGLLASVASRSSSARLDASVGAPGPRDFAVRITNRSSRGRNASIATRPTFVTTRTSLSSGRDGGRQSCISEKWKRNIFRREA